MRKKVRGVRERNRSRKAKYFAERKTEGVRVNGSGEVGEKKGGSLLKGQMKWGKKSKFAKLHNYIATPVGGYRLRAEPLTRCVCRTKASSSRGAPTPVVSWGRGTRQTPAHPHTLLVTSAGEGIIAVKGHGIAVLLKWSFLFLLRMQALIYKFTENFFMTPSPQTQSLTTQALCPSYFLSLPL